MKVHSYSGKGLNEPRESRMTKNNGCDVDASTEKGLNICCNRKRRVILTHKFDKNLMVNYVANYVQYVNNKVTY